MNFMIEWQKQCQPVLGNVCQPYNAEARNDVIDILTGKNTENTPLRSRRLILVNFTSGVFSIYSSGF